MDPATITDQQRMKFPKDTVDGLDTPSASQWPMPNVKLGPGTHRERESKAAHETPGAVILRLTQKRMGYTWGQLERLAQDRDAWRPLAGGLHASRGQRQWWWWWWKVEGILENATMLVYCPCNMTNVSQEQSCLHHFYGLLYWLDVAHQTFYLIQSQYADTGPTSPSTDSVTSDTWQGSYWSIKFYLNGMTPPAKVGLNPMIPCSQDPQLGTRSPKQ